MKLGRNDPCPCGSGKKYKRCCGQMKKIDKSLLPWELMTRLEDWVLGQPEMRDEFEKVLAKYARIEIGTAIEAFIFDYTLPEGRTPLRYFLDNAGLSPSEYSIYEGFMDSVFSVFEVSERYEKGGLKLADLVWDKEYFVGEAEGAPHLSPGDILSCRIAPFGSGFVVITSAPQMWHRAAAYSIKNSLRSARSIIKKRGGTAFDILDVLWGARSKTETIQDVKKALKKQLRSLGIDIDLRGLARRMNESSDVLEAFPEIRDFDFPSNDDYHMTSSLLEMLWNKYPRKEFEGKSPEDIYQTGPKEEMLILELLNRSMTEVNPEDYPSMKEVEVAMEDLRKKWLKTPQKVLGGKTPMEVILEERRALGNPMEEFGVHVVCRRVPNYDENKAARLYKEGNNAFKQGALMKAAELYTEVTEIYPDHYKAWGNLGNCFAYLGNKKKAIECYEKALSIQPAYALAKKNLEVIKPQDERHLAVVGLLGAMRGKAHVLGKKKKGEKCEEIDVWEEIWREDVDKDE
ncbi:MAG: tetratricopeptide repeat protein [Candidatus Thermoplasmatota archaeon]